MIHGQALNLPRVHGIDPRVADVKQQGGAVGGNLKQDQGATGFQPGRMELLAQPVVQRVQTSGNRSQVRGGRKFKQTFESFSVASRP